MFIKRKDKEKFTAITFINTVALKFKHELKKFNLNVSITHILLFQLFRSDKENISHTEIAGIYKINYTPTMVRSK